MDNNIASASASASAPCRVASLLPFRVFFVMADFKCDKWSSRAESESESQAEAVAEACVSCSCEVARKKRQVGMLTDADERMKWNGMSARLAEAGSKTSQSAKTSAEPNRERERENNLTFWLALSRTHTQRHTSRSEAPRQQSPLRWRSSASALSHSLLLALSHVGALFSYQSRVEIVD